jgi:hypothetical protein
MSLMDVGLTESVPHWSLQKFLVSHDGSLDRSHARGKPLAVFIQRPIRTRSSSATPDRSSNGGGMNDSNDIVEISVKDSTPTSSARSPPGFVQLFDGEDVYRKLESASSRPVGCDNARQLDQGGISRDL